MTRPADPGGAPDKARLDRVLVERGLAPTRAKAQALIEEGKVFSAELRLAKPSQLVCRDAPLRLSAPLEFVSRGGHKLAGALDALAISVTNLVCADIGASTGGFTDCLLQRGAERVYAVDVGEDQLAEALRHDARVIVMDRTNARDLSAASFPDRIALAVVDASFIGIDKLLPALARVLEPGAQLLALVKPQFEAGPRVAARTRGVIRDDQLRDQLITQAREAVGAHGFALCGGVDSSVPGPKGNREHFLLAVRS